MKIEKVHINNFRLLRAVDISFEDLSTVIVGRNNSGKTSLTEVFRRFFASRNFNLEDFSFEAIQEFRQLCIDFSNGEDELIIRNKLPKIELRLDVKYDNCSEDFSLINDFIVELDPEVSNVIINICYQLKDGHIAPLFIGLDVDRDDFCLVLKEKVAKLYHIQITASDPADTENTKDIDHKSLLKLIKIDFINAQRGLDDVTTKEKDILGAILSNIFRLSSLESAPAEMRARYEELDTTIKSIQNDVNQELTERINSFLPTLSIFGYPGLYEPNLSTLTTFNAQSILDSNTKVRYIHNDLISLPESYNGLGSRNLIYILFQLYSYFREYQSQDILPGCHIVFIEEPEAHLHPQMQEVFIDQINSLITKFSSDLNNGLQWPAQFIVTTHSTHIANKTSFNTIRYFFKRGNSHFTIVKDFNTEFNISEHQKDREFIYKYLTLTKCDLFFADKAVMIEGATERILMPLFIKKIDEDIKSNLSSQYISYVEIGGAYAHHFYKFLDFLELRTLVITDLDSVKRTTKNKRTTYPACQTSIGSHSSNSGIRNWFENEQGYADLSSIRSKTDEQKCINHRRIAYQIPEIPNTIPCGRSFEDAFILANKSLFSITGRGKALEKRVFDKAQELNDCKADFAIEWALKTGWSIPRYIKEGLVWLSK
ncbi:ATP-dependent endonuclease [Bacteroides thetaiotaomicron]|uniref:ATP-dependent endonuclease n=2 Tax=Bacteroides thetaiotaomicron TaxID=818 RepID=A0AAW4Z0C3_BACT4|nr:ATP-dependent endonuclease [Bacteroides thetaiotaomicron]MBV4308232.1 ATP-dependent endonuclease [Bacteroides thetaiotaomicron]MBV4327338.1 ATP-dependent endonuclease [Bacteroides thetaiotaomicron]MCB7381584.1 ATP-dependent endonuclease [Bacteroides thetaiotaomicron]MCE9235931.1 ATP-dependent endonuclease [Bacteroides thetaiotaomicron]MCE9265852.1 ATP-dependent endonuclease [Bacteroides thetaiotaomicron]